ncbi:SusC/RagA family TonB-linked outer membrane protein [Desertivirga arenae]|uniref:SusC/RagA family TonB-linked outer membrane protein n=1 Tax=Desertivirga arenae TaxID=2810309 RepID=UPI001A95F288|nr:SusC/RagA family TonB-linked outer membrane protein [Pedobacter sp. SYSU D00823]
MKNYTIRTNYALKQTMRISCQIFFVLALSTQLLLASTSEGQVASEVKIDLQAENKGLKNILNTIQKKSGLRFIYNDKLIDTYRNISISEKNKAVDYILKEVLKNTELDYLEQNKKIIIITRSAPQKNKEVSKAELLDIPVKGVVKSEKGETLIGVAVKIKGGTRGATTDTRGGFSLSVPTENTVLVFTYLGYEALEVPLNGRTNVEVVMRESTNNLNEVVVIGYGSQKRANVTASVATVKAENFVKGPVQDVGQLIQGKVAGLTVSNPNGDPTGSSQILLRGNTTLFGANGDPLVIIDGVPGSLKTVAPEDIESIDVLKDGSAAAIYGVRGTNGVILITTKRASGNFSNAVEYSGSASTQTIAKHPEMLTAQDYRAQIAAGTRDANQEYGASTDWLDEITQTPVTQIHNLTFRGGSNKTNYLASLNYRALEGIFLKSDNKTFTGRVDVNHFMLNDKLKVNLTLLSQNNNFTQTQNGGSFNGYTYRQALIRNPTEPVYGTDGKWLELPGNFNYENPLARIYESDGQTKGINSRVNGTLVYNPVKGLRLSSLFSYNRFNSNSGYSETKGHISNIRDNMNGYAAVGSSLSIDRLMELTAEYSTKIKDHQLTVLGGYGYQESESYNNFIQNWDFTLDDFGYNNIALGRAIKDGKGAIGSGKGESNLVSFFGRMTYSYKDKYLLMANVRHEGASQLFGANKPFGTFPAVSVGWRITNEGFMKNQKIFDDLKLRAGYGVTGNPPAGGFLSQALLGFGSFVYSDGKWIQVLEPSTNPNPYIRWEEKHESNYGIDFSMFKGRIFGNFDYYERRIKGLLYDYQVPSPPNLYPSTRANVGTMENKGLEAIISMVPVRSKKINWTTSFNFSTNTNKLISLSNDLYKTTNNYFTTGGTGEPIQTFTNIVFIGKGIGDFYGFKVVDIDENGKWIYEDNNGDRVPSASFARTFENKKVLGNGLPKYYAGWNNNFQYKNFDLSVTMRGAFDYQILNFERMYLENPTIKNYNRLKSSEEMVFGKSLLNEPLEFNSYYIEDGDFWKIDNITFGYSFNKLKTKYLKSARVFASCLNTFVFTGYSGIDPEVNRSGLSPGNDVRDRYPTTRTFTVGLNLNL